MRPSLPIRFLLLPFLAGFLLLGSACSGLYPKLEKPRLNLVDLQIVDATLFEQRYDLKLRIRNPNEVDLPVSGIHYTLHLEGKAFAEGMSAEPFTVPAFGEEEVTVRMSTSLFSAVRQVVGMLEKEDGFLDYRITGKVRLDLPLVKVLTFNEEGRLGLSPKDGAN